MVDGRHLIALLVCQIGRRVCALPVSRVAEIMRPLPVTFIPDAPAHVLGMAVVRGEPLPVVDLSRLLNETSSGITRFVCLRSDGGDARLVVAVDGVESIRRLPATALRRLPSLLKGDSPPLIDAVTPLDTELMLVLDSVRLLATADDLPASREEAPS